MNIYHIKFHIEDDYQYVSTLLAYGYQPYITLPTRITDFSGTCIDHIVIAKLPNTQEWHTEIPSGILYCDITDHLPCSVALTYSSPHAGGGHHVKLYEEKNSSKFKELVQNERWDELYIDGTDWYNNYIKLVYTKFQQFPFVRLSRKRAKDKFWIKKGIKVGIKAKHRLCRISHECHESRKYLNQTLWKSPFDDNIGAKIIQTCFGVFAENLAKNLTII